MQLRGWLFTSVGMAAAFLPPSLPVRERVARYQSKLVTVRMAEGFGNTSSVSGTPTDEQISEKLDELMGNQNTSGVSFPTMDELLAKNPELFEILNKSRPNSTLGNTSMPKFKDLDFNLDDLGKLDPQKMAKLQDASREVAIDLGSNKTLNVLLPSEIEDITARFAYAAATEIGTIDKNKLSRSAGDIVWPSSMALARLLMHCPSLVKGCRVLDIGSGLGLCGIAAAASGAKEVLLVDRDAAMLARAEEGAGLNTMAGSSFKTKVVDWNKIPTWPAKGSFDVILGADILNDQSIVQPLAKLLEHVAAPDAARVLVADPIKRKQRNAMMEAMANVEFASEMSAIPGSQGDILLVHMASGSWRTD
jgi:predicted nicotinamide N-methyase